MTQRFSLYEDLTRRGEPALLRRHLRRAARRSARRASRRCSSAAGPRRAARPARGHALGRLEAARRAGLRDHPRAAAAVPRRADRRRRSGEPARLLGADPPHRRRGHHRARDHALHGRGRALPPAGVHLPRRAARRRHARARSSSGASLRVVELELRARGRGRASCCARSPAVDEVAHFGHVAARGDCAAAPTRRRCVRGAARARRLRRARGCAAARVDGRGRVRVDGARGRAARARRRGGAGMTHGRWRSPGRSCCSCGAIA